MTTNLEELLTLEKLREWAESKQPDDVVGYPCLDTLCPLAWYLRDNGYNAVVSTEDIEYLTPDKSGYRREVMPWLMQEVVSRVDDYAALNLHADEFLSVLDSLEASRVALHDDTEASNH